MTLGEFNTLFQMVLLASLEAHRMVLKHLCTHHREVHRMQQSTRGPLQRARGACVLVVPVANGCPVAVLACPVRGRDGCAFVLFTFLTTWLQLCCFISLLRVITPSAFASVP